MAVPPTTEEPSVRQSFSKTKRFDYLYLTVSTHTNVSPDYAPTWHNVGCSSGREGFTSLIYWTPIDHYSGRVLLLDIAHYVIHLSPKP